jgi:hypothetical protein
MSRLASPLAQARPDMRPRRIAGILLAVATTLGLPAVATAHSLQGRYESPLPLAVYLIGAGVAVGLSFAFVLLRDRPSLIAPVGEPRPVPAWLRVGLRALGLLAWVWIVAQTGIGGGGDSDVPSLFLWVYGWVGVALLSAFVGPVWPWLDPFTTLHDLGAAGLRAVGVRGWATAPYPVRFGAWPATIGFVFFVWLELVFVQASAGQTLGIVMIAYTVVTLVAMAQFGRDAWNGQGETFSVWFGTLNRLARWRLDPADPSGQHVQRQPLGAGLVGVRWPRAIVVLVAVATASIIFDGLSQTQLYFDLFGAPAVPGATVILLGFLGLVVGAVLLVARIAGLPALGAGLLPIAVGYLIAHYLTFLIGDGQRIIIAISDPLQQGWDLFGTAFFEPGLGWLPPSVLWTVQIVAVVGGHMVGAWAGHQAALQTDPDAAVDEREARDLRRRQLPLAGLMVVLTVVTLWSLGQGTVQAPATQAAAPATTAAPATRTTAPATTATLKTTPTDVRAAS